MPCGRFAFKAPYNFSHEAVGVNERSVSQRSASWFRSVPVGPGPGDVRAVALHVPGDRDRVRRLAVVHGLDLLRRALLHREQPV